MLSDLYSWPDGELGSTASAKSWLLRLAQGDPVPCSAVPSTLDIPGFIQKVHENGSPATKETIQNAAAMALGECRPASHGARALKTVLQVNGLLRNTICVPTLCELFRRLPIVAPRNEEEFDLASVAVGVLAGLASDSSAHLMLEELVGSFSTDPRLSGQILAGLCRFKPQQYPEYVSDYIKSSVSLNGYFAEDYVGVRIMSLVGLKLFCREYSRLAKVDAIFVMDRWIAPLAHFTGPIEIAVRDEGVYLRWRDRSLFYLLTAPAGIEAHVLGTALGSCLLNEALTDNLYAPLEPR